MNLLINISKERTGIRNVKNNQEPSFNGKEKVKGIRRTGRRKMYLDKL